MRSTILAALAASSAFVVAQDVRITNLANTARKQWVDIAVPQTDAAALPLLCRVDPHGFIAIKGGNVGQHSTMFHALVSIGGGQSLTGRIAPVASNPAVVPAHAPSAWVTDNVPATQVVPVVIHGGQERRLGATTVREIENNPVRKVTHTRGRINGTPLVFDLWQYVWAKQDMVRVEMTFTNSDPRNGDLSFVPDAIWLETGEHLAIEYRQRLGMIQPSRQTANAGHPSYGKWVQLLTTRRTMGRGESLYFTGCMLCLAQSGAPTATTYTADRTTMTISGNERINTLVAAATAPVVGISTGWDGKWLAFGITPEIPPAFVGTGGWASANASASGFASMLTAAADLYVQRPRSLNRSASTTGAQDDFGACKGAYAVTVGDPRYLWEVGYSVAEPFFRPFHYREADGTPLLQRNHLGLRTWSQLVNCRTTQDRVGLTCPLPYSWPDNDWTAYDDQHRSHNYLNMMVALTGSHSLRAMIKDLTEIDQTQEPNRIDSPRGEGRLHMAWANMLLLLDDPTDRANLLAHMGRRVTVARNVWLGRNFVGNAAKPVRILATGTDNTFREAATNTPVPAIIVWEHAIATMGYYAAWRVTGDSRFHDMARELSKVIVNHCIFRDTAGAWIACTAVRYLQGAQEGDALPASSYYIGSPDVHVGVSFWTWIFPAVLICRDLHPTDTALVNRCNQIVTGMGAPDSWQRSEWWAVLPR